MQHASAPLFTDIHPGPTGGEAFWAQTSDGVQIRIAHWPAENAKGTVLMFPGRTEYIEKYGDTANELARRGMGTLAIDWRGQGLADRLLDDPLIGHVDGFQDYQKDVDALMRFARERGLPRPYFLLAHSMGGCIGLRSVMEGLPVQAVAFTGPMWGIHVAPHMRLPAFVLSRLLPKIGKGHLIPPGSTREPYVLVDAFEDNSLTTDRGMFEMMRGQIVTHPELALGGPSFHWLGQAFEETKHLAGRAAPSIPAVTWLGSNERIVEAARIHERMEGWQGGELRLVDGAEHEVLMEVPAIRQQVFDGLAKLFLDTVTR